MKAEQLVISYQLRLLTVGNVSHFIYLFPNNCVTFQYYFSITLKFRILLVLRLFFFSVGQFDYGFQRPTLNRAGSQAFSGARAQASANANSFQSK